MTSSEFRILPLALALCGIAPFMVNGLVNSLIADDALLYWGFEILTWVAIPALIALQVARSRYLDFNALGFRVSLRGQRSFTLLVLACVLLAPLCYAVYRGCYDFFSSILPATGYFEYESIVPRSGPLHFLVVAYLALSAGLVEEFLYRGMLWRAFSGLRYSTALFLLLSPLLFSLAHWEDGPANLAATWVFGVFMAIVYVGLRNLWPLIAGHVFTDLVWFG